jgi:hypothetical protein
VDLLKVLELVKAVFMVNCVSNGHLALVCEVRSYYVIARHGG